MAKTPKLLRSFDGRYTELVFTFLSDRVSATLYYHSKNAEPRQLACIEETLPRFDARPGREEIIDESLLLTRSVCTRILEEAHELYQIRDILKDDQRIDYVSCFLSVPWVEYQYYNIHQQYDSPRRVDSDHINSLLHEEIPQGYMRIDRHISPVFANGYASGLDVVLNNKIRTLDFAICEGLARFNEVETLYQLLTSELNIESTQLYLYSVGNTLKTYAQSRHAFERDYTVAHVHGYSSDITVVRDGEVIFAGVIDYGYNDFARKIVDSGIAPDYQQAWSILNMRSRAELLPELEERLASTGADIANEFELEIRQQIAKQEGLDEPVWMDMPRDWYLLADRAVSRYLGGFLRDSDKKRRVVPVLAGDDESSRSQPHIHNLHRALVTSRSRQDGLALVR